MFAVHDIVQKIGTRACLSVKYVGLDPFACRLVLNGYGPDQAEDDE